MAAASAAAQSSLMRTGSSAGSGDFRIYNNSLGGRLNDTSGLRGGRFSEVAALPEIGERTIYVTDEGLVVSTSSSQQINSA